MEIALIISVIAILISGLTYWNSFHTKKHPVFTFSKWALAPFGNEKNELTGFGILVEINLSNFGKLPVTIKDILLKIIPEQGDVIYYHALMMTNPMDNVSPNKGVVPLPVLIGGDSIYSFEHALFFVPVNKTPGQGLLNRSHNSAKIEALVLTDLDGYYKLQETQTVNEDDLINAKIGETSYLLSNNSISSRKLLLSDYPTDGW